MKGAVNTYHPHNLGVYIVRDSSTLSSDVLEHFGKGLCYLDLEFGVGDVGIE